MKINDVRILLIDNYDSFTYNLVQAFCKFGAQVLVYRNDKISNNEAIMLEPTHIVISPGPGRPENAGNSISIIEEFCQRIPILGVCLGHQCLVSYFGGKIVSADRLMHGKTSFVNHDNKTIFSNIKNPFEAGRYHSLCVESKSLPSVLEVSVHSRQGEIMGIRHKHLPLEGVQFHPESILTSEGERLLSNFTRMTAV